jgi:hypothetical protein
LTFPAASGVHLDDELVDDAVGVGPAQLIDQVGNTKRRLGSRR